MRPGYVPDRKIRRIDERLDTQPTHRALFTEGMMQGFEPVRFFQLRNGLQEFLFRYAGDEENSKQMTLAELTGNRATSAAASTAEPE